MIGSSLFQTKSRLFVVPALNFRLTRLIGVFSVANFSRMLVDNLGGVTGYSV